MGCPCKNKKPRAATASAAKQQYQPPGSPGKPLLWTGPPEDAAKKTDGK